MITGFDICEQVLPTHDGFLAVVTAWVPARADPASAKYALTGPAPTLALAETVRDTLAMFLRDRMVARAGTPARRVAPEPLA